MLGPAVPAAGSAQQPTDTAMTAPWRRSWSHSRAGLGQPAANQVPVGYRACAYIR